MGWDVFISYASEDKDEVAEPLAHALREAGLSVWYDKLELRLGDNLRRRIDEGLSNSRFGIVILSPSFFKKHWPQAELDGLVQREVRGSEVILPIWYQIDTAGVLSYSPILAGRVAAKWADGLDAVASEVLKVVRPSGIGLPRSNVNNPLVSEPWWDPTPLVLFMSLRGHYAPMGAGRIESGKTLKFELVSAAAPQEKAFFEDLSANEEKVFVAFDDTAILARLGKGTHRTEAGRSKWHLVLLPEEVGSGTEAGMEIGTSSYSSDQIAEMRARRILLNEQFPDVIEHNLGRSQAGILEALVGGINTLIEVNCSPLPEVYAHYRDDVPFFVAVARLAAIMWLRLSGTVEHIFRLEMAMPDPPTLRVKFEGRRARMYTNVEPAIIRFEGTCRLQ